MAYSLKPGSDARGDAAASTSLVSKRPAVGDRRFVSQSVEDAIQSAKSQIADPELQWLFENCYPNTLDTTVHYQEINGVPDTFVITGDIDAMWLRDSSAQVWPYLPLARDDQKLQRMLWGVINRQVKCILVDPYANAFQPDDNPKSEWMTDQTDMKLGVHERKWEIDSLCYPIRLAYGYWDETGDTRPFDDNWEKAMDAILHTFVEQQRKTSQGPYHFQRVTATPTDTQFLGGYGLPTKPTGLIHSMFRPSDDSTVYPYLIPSNFFAVVSLRHLAELLKSVRHNADMAQRATALADEVEAALKQYAIHRHPALGDVYAYEVDGFGNASFMDDANVPSLLALPYLGAVNVNDSLYQSTRHLVWSDNNPFFFQGKYEGIGGPHVGMDMIWPMSILMYGFTSTSEDEIRKCFAALKDTNAGTGFMHESFNKDDPSKFSRSWFAWANTLFGEFVLHTLKHYPNVLS